MQTDVVTGAFGYSGAAIARELVAAGHQVRTLTGHPGRAPAGIAIDVRPLDFADAGGLERDLRGAHTLYNTYWVRFPHGGATHAAAVANSRTPVRRRRPRRNPAHRARLDHPRRPGLAVPVLQRQGRGRGAPARPGRPVRDRPARHLLRRRRRPAQQHRVAAAPAAGVRHRRPGRLPRAPHPRRRPGPALPAARRGAPTTSRVDAVGPESLAFREMVLAIRAAVGSRALVVPAPGWAIPPLSAVLGAALHDVLLTREEYQAMADGLADSDGPVNRLDQPLRVDRPARPGPRPHLRQRAHPPLPLTPCPQPAVRDHEGFSHL